MSILPYGFSSPFDYYPMDYYQPRHRHHAMNPFREVQQMDRMINSMFRELAHEQHEHGSQMKYNENGDLSLHCQTSGFKPEELTVDVDGDKMTVSGHHVESREGESVERHFSRTIRLPKEVDQSMAKCELDDNGDLFILVPRHQQLEAPKKNVPIEMKKGDEQK